MFFASGATGGIRAAVAQAVAQATKKSKSTAKKRKPSLLKNVKAKGNPGAIKKSIQHVTQSGEAKKKETKQKIESLKITGNSKKNKQSNKGVSFSGPGDLVI